jgi:thiol-disulfide isomerase/thioredoxin
MRLAVAMIALGVLTAAPSAAQVNLACLGGERLSEGDLARGTTIIVVWASWSPKSRDIVERVNPIVARWGGSARVLTVTFQEERAAVERFLAGKGLNAPVCMDTEGVFSRRHNVSTLPGLLVVRDGQVAYRGKLPQDADQVLGELLR